MKPIQKLMIGAGILLLLVFVAAASAVGQRMMSVQVRTGEVRATPTFLGKIVARLAYGDRVAVNDQKGDWRLVQLPAVAQQGWIHQSALSEKKIVLQAGAQDVKTAAGSDELALAGKGFNDQVEKAFKEKNPEMDFTWIDRMEKLRITPEQIQVFVDEGRLEPKGDTP